jgi:hypothetical protein
MLWHFPEQTNALAFPPHSNLLNKLRSQSFQTLHMHIARIAKLIQKSKTLK